MKSIRLKSLVVIAMLFTCSSLFATPSLLNGGLNNNRTLSIDSGDADAVAKMRENHRNRLNQNLNNSFNKFEECNKLPDLKERAKCKQDFINQENKPSDK